MVRLFFGAVCISMMTACAAKIIPEAITTKKNDVIPKVVERQESLIPSIPIIEENIKIEGSLDQDVGRDSIDPARNSTSQKLKFNSFASPEKDKESSSQVKSKPFQSNEELQDIYFEFNQFGLSPAAEAALRENAQWFKKHPSAKAQLEGHCDERGTNNYNLALGDKRANSAKKLLMTFGIQQSRLITISYGEEKPFCFEGKESCWSKNRRVHFLISSKE